jgi:hypothetical protein
VLSPLGGFFCLGGELDRGTGGKYQGVFGIGELFCADDERHTEPIAITAIDRHTGMHFGIAEV